MKRVMAVLLVLLLMCGVAGGYARHKQETRVRDSVLDVLNGEKIDETLGEGIKKELRGYQKRTLVADDTEILIWEDVSGFFKGLEEAERYMEEAPFIQISDDGDYYPDIYAQEEYYENGGESCETIFMLEMYDESGKNKKDDRVIERYNNLYIKQSDISFGENGTDVVNYKGMTVHIYDYELEKETYSQRKARKPYTYKGKGESEFYYLDKEGNVLVVGCEKGLLGIRSINI